MERIMLQLQTGERLFVGASFGGVQGEYHDITNRAALEKICKMLNEHPQADALFVEPARILLVL